MIYVIIVILLTFCLFIGIAYLLQGPPYVPTDDDTLSDMLVLLKKYHAHKVIDLGSGDGKLVIAFAKAGYDSYGIELNPLMVLRSRRAIKKANLQNAHILWGSFWQADFSAYDTLVIYGIKHIMDKLGQHLITHTNPNTTMITNFFVFPKWKPIEKKDRLVVYTINAEPKQRPLQSHR